MLPPQQLPKGTGPSLGLVGQGLGKPHINVFPFPMALSSSVLPEGSLAGTGSAAPIFKSHFRC